MMPLPRTAGCTKASRAPALWLAVIAAGSVLGGCQSMPMGLAKSPETVRKTAFDDGDETGIAGPTERRLKAERWDRDKHKDPSLTEALARYDAAMKLYDQKQYAEAEKAFNKLVKERRSTYESFRGRWERWWGLRTKDEIDPYDHYGDPVEEDAMFMLAESQFAQKRYSWAQDSYDGLLERFPSTRHMEKSTHRLFRIGMYWLGFSSGVADTGDVKLTKSESIDPAKPPKAPQIPPVPILPNLTDKTKPVFDTSGRALQALRSIWLHDAAGPLADDALMLSANYHLRTGDFVEAARLYRLMREQYPDSPHFQDAHLLGAYVTMASYEGASYDGAPLAEARGLKQTALQMFPNLSEEERERLKKDVDRMNTAEIGRLWDKVEYYRVKRQPQSMEVYCNLIINQYPDSKYAERARATLKRIKKPPKPVPAPPAKMDLDVNPELPAEDGDADGNDEEIPRKPREFKPAELSGHIDVDSE